MLTLLPACHVTLRAPALRIHARLLAAGWEAGVSYSKLRLTLRVLTALPPVNKKDSLRAPSSVPGERNKEGVPCKSPLCWQPPPFLP